MDKRYKSQSTKISATKLVLKVSPQVFKHLREGTISHITRISFRYLVRLKLVEDSTLALHDFRFIRQKDNKDITEEYSK